MGTFLVVVQRPVTFISYYVLCYASYSTIRMISDVDTSGTNGHPLVVVLSTSIACSMLLAVLQDADLVLCYTLSVLATNVGAVLLHSVLHQYHRSLYCIGHMYIGAGQHVVLRISLGCIEIASSMFRAVSLSLRVVCNATAGHVLLAVLIEMTVSSTSMMPLCITWYVLLWILPLVLLKMTTCIIQGVVHHRLLVVYYEELTQ